MATLAPACWNSLAVANPIPLLPPVITATFPSNAFMVFFLSYYLRTVEVLIELDALRKHWPAWTACGPGNPEWHRQFPDSGFPERSVQCCRNALPRLGCPS